MAIWSISLMSDDSEFTSKYGSTSFVSASSVFSYISFLVKFKVILREKSLSETNKMNPFLPKFPTIN